MVNVQNNLNSTIEAVNEQMKMQAQVAGEARKIANGAQFVDTVTGPVTVGGIALVPGSGQKVKFVVKNSWSTTTFEKEIDTNNEIDMKWVASAVLGGTTLTAK